MKLVFLLEELSTKYLLDELLPKILQMCFSRQSDPHNGKQALERSIPRKLRGWNEPGDVCFVIVQDQDSQDCKKLKKDLLALCEGTGKRVLVRIACQEMESWYFGDMQALALAYNNPKLAKISAQKKYRIPDAIPSPKEELYRLIPEHHQISGAKRVAPHMDIERNTSESFRQFVSGVRRFVETST